MAGLICQFPRKSSDEGLEQSFNSLHAQREACEAYVKSQAGEGWKALKTAYDDGGFSGGSMDRPGLKSLLADIAAALVDVVVVYKVDRLTRSLMDFAKIVETFDGRGVSFVSVTQAFNTTTSMGRLTLNVLLSFAQFEREVTGERIRDKIAASKAKGMWMGGNLPLGYDKPNDLATRALVVNEAEAQTVRLIFQRYLELGSARLLRDWLNGQGLRSKVWVSRAGRPMGGQPFNRGSLFHLLKNRTNLGEILHGELCHPGAHHAIVDAQAFEAVQARLESQTRLHRDRPMRGSSAMLKGLIFNAEGVRMVATFTAKQGGRVYRYYVSAASTEGVLEVPRLDTIQRISGPLVERQVRGVLDRLRPPPQTHPLVRVEVHPATLQILLRRPLFFRRPGDPDAELQTLQHRLGDVGYITPDPVDPDLVRATLQGEVNRPGARVEFKGARDREQPRRDPDPILIKALRRGHRIMAATGGVSGRPETMLADRRPLAPHDRSLVCLAFLAPDIQAQILEGKQPVGLNLAGVLAKGVPPSWDDQRRVFGFPANEDRNR